MGNKSSQSGGKKKQITLFYKKCVHPMLQKRNYLKFEAKFVKTLFRNGIYDKFCVKMGVFWILDKNEENRYIFTGLPSFIEIMPNISRFGFNTIRATGFSSYSRNIYLICFLISEVWGCLL